MFGIYSYQLSLGLPNLIRKGLSHLFPPAGSPGRRCVIRASYADVLCRPASAATNNQRGLQQLVRIAVSLAIELGKHALHRA